MKRRELFKKLGIALTGIILAPSLIIKIIKEFPKILVDIPFPINTSPNDILITTIMYDGVDEIGNPPGWNLISQDPVENVLNIAVYWKRAEIIENKKATFTSKKEVLGGRMYAYSGVKSIELKQ